MSGKGKAGIAVRIQTLGCAKNSVDAEVMSGLLVKGGCRIVSRGPADVGIVNTCGFIRDAKEESIGEILALAREKEGGRIRRLVVAGCLAKRYRDELPETLPEVDGNVLLSGYRGLPGRFCRARVTGAREWDLMAKSVDSDLAPGILT